MPASARERRLEEIYSAALKQDASGRGEFLRQACGGDTALRQEIESLLGDEHNLGDFLEKPALEATPFSVASGQERSLVGHTLGPYDVLSLPGAGGMGEVYSARDTRLGVRGGGRGYHFGGPRFANLSPRLSLFTDHLRTVLAVKGSLRRAQQRRALDGSGPF